jgi:hypothetical protein
MSKNAGADGMDLLDSWREWFIQNERTWNEELTGMMKQNPVAQAIGKEINAALYGQEMLTQGMAASLALFNMPTRDDILALGERLGRLEDSVARQEASLVRLQNSALAESHAPPRTRKADAISAEHGGTADPNAVR